MRIALFGGAFDPPHLGHVLAATYAYVVSRVDEVWVLPVAKHAYGKPLSPWAQRWSLCEAAFARLDFVRLRDDEQRNPSGYSFDLIRRLGDLHPDHRWCVVGGSDTSADIANWYRGPELLRLVEIIPVPRRGFDDQHPAALPAISSSAIRASLTRGDSVAELVPPAVELLIRREGWYK